jgi:HD-GYP domain-containing protein (c-di-GMP phosphodiesterase class II)
VLLIVHFFLYKNLRKFKKKVYKSVGEFTRFSTIFAEIYTFSKDMNRDFKKEISDILLDFASKFLSAEFLVFYSYDNKSKNFLLYHYFYNGKKNIDSLKFENLKTDFQGLHKEILEETFQLFNKNDKSNYQKFPLIKYFKSSLLTYVIKTAKEPIGVLMVYTNVSEAYRDIFKISLNYVATAINNIEFYQEMKSISFQTLTTLSQAIDAKSHYTGQHTERVLFYSQAILQKMDYSKYGIIDIDKFKNNVEFAAMLHDVGKIGISELILDKKDPLTEDEWDIMCQHPLIGSKIVSHITFFKEIKPLILHHHEKYDGTGYLDGLKGEDIPLGARILSVADAYDAMTSTRSYRKALSKEIAIAEILKNSAKQFDPYIAELFVKYLIEDNMEFNQCEEPQELKVCNISK